MNNNFEIAHMNTFQPIELYGSFWINFDRKRRVALSMLWQLPHELRRHAFKSFFRNDYWKIMRIREKLEATFPHPEHPDLIYGFDKLHQHKCMFVHIPKCAGISVGQNLFGRCVTHSAITDYQIMFGVQPFMNYFKFTIVRNPWDRLVSAFHFAKAGGFDKQDTVWANKYLSRFDTFHEFVLYLDGHRELLRWHLIAPQYLWLTTPSGRHPLDYIGKMESLDSSIGLIRHELNLPAGIITKMNASSRGRGYGVYYTDVTRRIVADIYKKDIKLLGYKFD